MVSAQQPRHTARETVGWHVVAAALSGGCNSCSAQCYFRSVLARQHSLGSITSLEAVCGHNHRAVKGVAQSRPQHHCTSSITAPASTAASSTFW
jgi:hypothetical protein